MKKEKVVIFDFDGVIVDSLVPAYSVWTDAGADLTLDEYRARFNGNVNKANKPTAIDFHKHYRPKVNDLNIFPGIKDVIEKLSSDYRLVIVSSTLNEFIELVLKKNGLSDNFDDVLGNEVSTSKVEKFNMVFDKYRVSADDCVLITDTTGDIREANEVSMRAIAVTWGYQTAETLCELNPAALVDKPADIITEVKRLL